MDFFISGISLKIIFTKNMRMLVNMKVFMKNNDLIIIYFRRWL